MADDFKYDVFLSHSPKDKNVVRPIAERLRAGGLRVWLEEWEVSLFSTKVYRAKKIEEGLEHSRVQVLCISEHVFGPEWAQLEARTFRFRDPLNRERRFIILRFDAAAVEGFILHVPYISWEAENSDQQYAMLYELCRLSEKSLKVESTVSEHFAERTIQLDYARTTIWVYAFSPDRKLALTGSEDTTVRLWSLDRSSF